MRNLIAVAGLAGAVLMPTVAASAAPGERDPSFGTNGIVSIQLSSEYRGTQIAELDVVADGRIVAGGTSRDGPRNVFALLRFLSSGRLDPTFGTGGVVRATLDSDKDASHPANSQVAAVVPLPDGGLVALGSTTQGMGVLRADAAGRTVWARLHELGRTYTSVEGFVNVGTTVSDAALVGDKLVVSGSATRGTSVYYDPMLARLNLSDGSLDPSFGEAGRLIAPRPAGTEYCEGSFAPFGSFVVRSDGSIVVGGSVGCGMRGQFPQAILRGYTTTGEPLAGFQTDPKTVRSFGPLRAGPGTSLLAIGLVYGGFYGQPALMRLTASGALAADPVPLSPPETPAPVGIEFQRDGRLVGAGAGTAVRYLPDGSRDASFGVAGAAPTGIAYPSDVALQPDGKILIAGKRDDGTSHPEERVTLIRLLGGTRAGVPVTRVRRAAVRRRGVSIGITCRGARGAAGCRGTARITSIGRRHTSFSRARTFTLAAGARTTLRIALNATVRRRIANAPHRRLTVRLIVASPVGTTRRRLVLTASRSALR